MSTGAGPEPDASGVAGLPRLLPRALAAAGSLAGDYLRGREAAVQLFPRRARAGAAGGSAAGRSGGGRMRVDPDVLRTSSGEAERRLEEVASGRGVFVSTGQQPLLFLGPLFVLYKALTAVDAARRLEDASGTPALALFWVAADDHDWAEVGRSRILDTGNELRTFRLQPPEGRAGRAVGPTALPGSIEGLVDELSQTLPASDFRDDVLESIRGAWRPGRPVARAFGETLEEVLDGRPFAWIDASSPEVRRSGAPLVRRVLEEDGPVLERLRAGAERSRGAGYEPQMPPRPGGLPVFVDTEDGRRRLFRREAGGWSVGKEGDALPRDRLLRRLEERPEGFSASGALRPVLESWLLPVEATVLGPSEIAYWAQLPPLFEWAGTPMPRVEGRRSWTVLEGKVEKVLEKVGAGPGDFRDGGAEVAERVTAGGRPEAVEEALAAARRDAGAAMERVEEAVADELPGIRSAVGAARHGIFEALAGLEDAVDGRVRERHDVLLQQIRKAAAHLRPGGEPQERVVSPLYYLARYGERFVELVDRATRDSGERRPPPGPDA